MQKRALKRTKNFGSVILYRNDIEELLQLLSKTVFVIHLKDAEYDYDNVDEMQKHRGDVVRQFIIKAEGNFAELELPRRTPKSGHIGSPQNRPYEEVVRDVDDAAGQASLQRHEQRIERR